MATNNILQKKKTVEILLPHIEHLRNKIIWCPFDKADSQFVQVLRSNGYKVVFSHIEYNQDFFKYQPNNWVCIISNPPYKDKRKFIEHCLELGKPFALLLPATMINDNALNDLLNPRYVSFIIPNRRTKFYNALTGEIGRQPTFKAIYLGYNIFKEQIIFENLK